MGMGQTRAREAFLGPRMGRRRDRWTWVHVQAVWATNRSMFVRRTAMALLPRLRAFVPRLSAPRPPPTPPTPPLPPDASLSQRLKHLIKSYGWYALGVYIVFSTLDFAVAFAAVNLLGADYVAGVTASVKATIYSLFSSKSAEPGLE